MCSHKVKNDDILTLVVLKGIFSAKKEVTHSYRSFERHAMKLLENLN